MREIADALSALRPEDFVAARDARAREATAARDRDLARQVRALRRPSIAAWAVNRLVREAPAEIDQLLDLGARLRAAQEDVSGWDLRELNRERRETLATLAHTAATLADAAGHPLAEPVQRQVQATLGAALADPVAGAALRSGLLTSDFASTGFAPVELDRAVAVPPDPAAIDRERQPRTPPADGARPREAAGAQENQEAGDQKAGDQKAGHQKAGHQKAGDQKASEEAERTRERAREAAERAARDADDAVTAATRAVDEAQAVVDDVVRRRATLAERIRDLNRQVLEARQADEDAGGEERRARRALDAAARAARVAERQAVAARARAEQAAQRPT